MMRKDIRAMLGKSVFAAILALAFGFLAAPEAHAEDLPITSYFGWRIHPISGEYKFHAGLDLGYDYGTPIPALFDGVVVMSGDYGDGYGNQVLIYHAEIDSYTRYAHMMETTVCAGEALLAGTVIGYVGSTGNSTGPHLHLEYIIRSTDGGFEYTDPLALWQ